MNDKPKGQLSNRGIKPKEELRDKVQAALEEMAADGTMAEISDKWFGRDVTVIGK